MSPIHCDYQNEIRPLLCDQNGVPRRGLILNFSRLPAAALSQIKKEFDLSMTVAELKLCQAEYGRKSGQLPTVDEILFLDGIAYGKHHSGNFARVSQCLFEDPEIARTYSDLMRKIHETKTIVQNQAPSVFELLSALSKSLMRSGRVPVLNDVILASDPYDVTALIAAGYTKESTLSISDGLPTATVFKTDDRKKISLCDKAKNGDAFLLLSPFRRPMPPKSPVSPDVLEATESESESESIVLSEQSTEPELSFVERLTILAKSEIYRSIPHALRTVDERGIAVALASLFDGVYAELDKIPSVFDGGELYDLSVAEHGSVIVAVPQDAVSTFAEEVRIHGIVCAQIARAVSGSHFTVRREGHPPFLFASSFIRQFADFSVPFLAESKNLLENGTCSMQNGVRVNETSVTNPAAQGRIYTASGIPTHTFRDAIDVTLSALFDMALCGAPLSDMTAFTVYSYSASMSSHSFGRFLEAFLGVYRVLAETAVLDFSAVLPRTDHSSPALSVFFTAPDASNATYVKAFRKSGSFVYLLRPRQTEQGIPNFSDVRSLLKMLYALSKVGGVLSSRVVSHTSPRSAISEMCLSFELNRSPEITEDQLAHSIDGVYIILESDRAIEGLKPIGQTKNLSTSSGDVSETDEFPKIS